MQGSEPRKQNHVSRCAGSDRWRSATLLSGESLCTHHQEAHGGMDAKVKRLINEWSQQFDCCAVCHWPEHDHRRRLEVHHLEGGSVRTKGNSAFNFLKLCSRCHGVFHSGKIFGRFPDLNKGILLQAKREADPKNYDPASMAALRNKKALSYEPQPIPGYYIEERVANSRPSRRA